MTEKKVLIAYGSRFGSTEEISQEIAEVLKKKGIAVTLFNLRLMKNSDSHLQEYDGLLVGSGIKMGKWTKETRKFLINNSEKIRKMRTKGVFISSGWISFPSKREQAKKDYLEDVIKSLDIDIDLFEAF
ncbi:MAG: flavodoxin domain-containing protein [Candidatus Hodarchaeales archaeon]|jgi:menaquinone-dependent protoporphyrinogen oxidase